MMASIMRHAVLAHAGRSGLRRGQLPFEQFDTPGALAVGGEACQINRMAPARLQVVVDSFDDGKVISFRDVVRVAGISRGWHFNALASGVPVGVIAHDGASKWIVAFAAAIRQVPEVPEECYGR